MNGRVLDTVPASEPVGLQAAIDHLRLDADTIDQEEATVRRLIGAARQWVEQTTGRALITQTWSLWLDAFPAGAEIVLPLGSLQSVSLIQYVDTDGVTQTWDTANYYVATTGIRGRVMLANGAAWPGTISGRPESVRVQFVCGYGTDPARIPSPIQAAMLLLIGNWYENREATISGTIIADVPMGVEALLAPYRIVEIV